MTTKAGRRRGVAVFVGLVSLWSLGVVYGMHLLWKYKTTPGIRADARSGWPTGSKLAPAHDRATLVLLVHPYCPCTRATVSELSVLMTRLQGKVSTYVLFVVPESERAEFEPNDLWRTAAAIPGVTVLRDDGGLEAARFGAKTSGQVYLYATDGSLAFSGGITSARGHEGDSPGRRRVIDIVTQGRSDRADGPVFGCALELPAAGGEPR